MFSLTSSHRFFLYSEPTDMRKSFDGLCGLVQSKMGRNPVSGEVFLFLGTRKNAIKLLHWEKDGFVLYYKRLEKGTFAFPLTGPEGNTYPLSWPHLVLLAEGITVLKHRQQARYQAL
jgi:transposase